MPEGLEVYILGIAIQKLSEQYALPFCVETKGKHLLLIYQDRVEDWSFGIHGRIKWCDYAPFLTKLSGGIISGSLTTYKNMEAFVDKRKLGIDFVCSSRMQIDNVVEKWRLSNRTLGSLILDQTYICGIGTAWGSEILHDAGNLKPYVSAKEQDLDCLTDSICRIRDNALMCYTEYISKHVFGEYGMFVNAWVANLYRVRNMKVYRRGEKVKCGSREWWIEGRK
jgi:hypothetical protein